MGLAPGGLMHQEIYEDDYGFDAWDTDHPSRCFVHILNSVQYQSVTGKKPPTRTTLGQVLYRGRSALVRLLQRGIKGRRWLERACRDG